MRKFSRRSYHLLTRGFIRNVAAPGPPTPEDQEDEYARRYTVLALITGHQWMTAPTSPQSLFLLKPIFQPTLHCLHYSLASNPSCSQSSSTRDALPSALKSKKTFVDLTEESWYSGDEEPAPNPTYPPFWRGASEPSKAAATNKPPRNWRRADRQSKRAGVRRSYASSRHPSLTRDLHTPAERATSDGRGEEINPPFACFYRSWKFRHRYYQCAKP